MTNLLEIVTSQTSGVMNLLIHPNCPFRGCCCGRAWLVPQYKCKYICWAKQKRTMQKVLTERIVLYTEYIQLVIQ